MLKTAIAFVLLGSPAAAQIWTPLDSRAKGMGNAGVALSEGTAGAYWNPANLAQPGGLLDLFGGFGFNISVLGDVGVEGDTISTLDYIADLFQGYDFQAEQNALNTPSIGDNNPEFQHAIQILDGVSQLNGDATGAFANGGGGIEFRFGNFGLFHRAYINAAADPSADFTGALNFSSLGLAGSAGFFAQITGGPLTPAAVQLRDALVAAGFPAGQNDDAIIGDLDPDVDELAFNAQQAIGDAGVLNPEFQNAFIKAALGTNTNTDPLDVIYNNQSGVTLRGILVRETGLSAGVSLDVLPLPAPVPFLSGINVGLSLKEVTGETFYLHVPVNQVESGDQVLDDLRKEFRENRRRSNKFSMDAGVSVSPIPWLTVGISGKNLIPMEFASKGPEPVKIKPTARGGVGFKPLGILKVGFDVDLLEQDLDEFFSGFDYRQVAGGAELNLGFVAVRGGAFGNLASSESGVVYSGGLGFGLFGLHLDVDAQLAPGRTPIETASTVNGYETDKLTIPDRLGVGASIGFDLGF